MKSDYKVALNKSIQKKRLELSTTFSEEILASIFSTLEFTPRYLSSLAEKFDNKIH
ncbi:MAG: hypothetical protein IPK10_13285 [Bacteroidetes bacterium]|nr:hypothetical protein [Bacteroidota bacterium]